jgi:hypothetical protein
VRNHNTVGTVSDMAAFTNKFQWVRAFSALNSGLTSTQHHVALMLADKMNVDGECFVTHARLAQDIRMSERTVCEALTALADMEWVERTPGRAGRATTYRMARPAGWEPPAPDAPPPGRESNRQPVNPADHERAHRYLVGLYAETGIDLHRADDDTATTRRLLGVLRRHLTHQASSPSGRDKVRAILVETSLTTATDPAAVLLNRYKKALRLYPEFRPTKRTAKASNVDDLIGHLVDAMKVPKTASHHTNTCP